MDNLVSSSRKRRYAENAIEEYWDKYKRNDRPVRQVAPFNRQLGDHGNERSVNVDHTPPSPLADNHLQSPSSTSLAPNVESTEDLGEDRSFSPLQFFDDDPLFYDDDDDSITTSPWSTQFPRDDRERTMSHSPPLNIDESLYHDEDNSNSSSRFSLVIPTLSSTSIAQSPHSPAAVRDRTPSPVQHSSSPEVQYITSWRNMYMVPDDDIDMLNREPSQADVPRARHDSGEPIVWLHRNDAVRRRR